MVVQDQWQLDDDLGSVNWASVKSRLTADNFDNGRSPAALQASFENSAHAVIARADDGVVGTARLLSDGVCNSYLVDVWTWTPWRQRGVATAMIGDLADRVPGQHIGLQTDGAVDFYLSRGFRRQPEFLSLVVGQWLDNDANR